MSEISSETTPVKAPAKRRARRVKRAKVENGQFAGITAKDCPSGCTAGRCVISTVGVCAHPYKSAVNGFGPVTMANREKARKLIKHQMVDLKG